MWKAFDELEALGWIGPERPRVISVQAEGCAPIVKAYEAGERHAATWQNAHTIAPGIRVPAAIADYLILDAVRHSGGTAIAVSDDEILAAMSEMARLEGIFAAPEGAATYAGYKKLLAIGLPRPRRERRAVPDRLRPQDPRARRPRLALTDRCCVSQFGSS